MIKRKRKNKKSNRRNKNKRTDFSGILISLTSACLVVIVFVFHLFLSRQIDSLEKEKIEIQDSIEMSISRYETDSLEFESKFDKNLHAIADRIYGKRKWEREPAIPYMELK